MFLNYALHFHFQLWMSMRSSAMCVSNSNHGFVCTWIWGQEEEYELSTAGFPRQSVALLVIFQLLMWADCWGHLPELHLFPPHWLPLQSRNFYLQNHSVKWKSSPNTQTQQRHCWSLEKRHRFLLPKSINRSATGMVSQTNRCVCCS